MKPEQYSIPLSVPEIKGNEMRYIKKCLDTNWVSSAGRYVDSFENKMLGYIGRKYAIACVNGTAALHIALLAAGIKPDEEAIVPALTFVATANVLRYANAWPVFIDVEPDTWQIDAQRIADFLNKECVWKNGRLINRNTRRAIKAIMPVHLLGHPADMGPIMRLAHKFGLLVIADAAQGLGALYKGRHAAGFGDIACLSFNGNKIITTGGGGMLLTDRPEWAKRARYLITQARDDSSEFIHNEVGYNYRLTNIQAAMGIAQMENIGKHITRKRSIARHYQAGLKDIPGIRLPVESVYARSIFWLYTIRINKVKTGIGSRELLRKLNAGGIQARPLWHPLHSLRPFKRSYAYRIKVANELYRDCLSLPSSVGLAQSDQDKVINVIRESTIKK
ncbi:MAG: LegC family aminotransferase [Candidatus Omnitrophota bacterium]